MTQPKHCENNDGPANFEGFGHVLCWKCYSRFIKGEMPREMAEVFASLGESDQASLQFDATAKRGIE
jgi:hypothetical protein